MKRTKQNSPNYTWGIGCSGWHLVQSEDLSVIQELMPPKSTEREHYHHFAQQFFQILQGEAIFIIEGKEVKIKAGEGIQIAPFVKHQIRNEQIFDLEFLVISQPNTRTDRIDAPFKKEKPLSLNGKKFMAQKNTPNGESGTDTLFHYRQKGETIWATYEGGDILFGTLSGRISKNHLLFTYQHQNLQGEFKTGKCSSIIKVVNHKLSLYETWEWTCDDYSKGTSILVEI